jgi:hypothetical protein
MVVFISDPSKEGTNYPDQKSTKDASQEELLHSFQDFENDIQDLFKVSLQGLCSRKDIVDHTAPVDAKTIFELIN